MAICLNGKEVEVEAEEVVAVVVRVVGREVAEEVLRGTFMEIFSFLEMGRDKEEKDGVQEFSGGFGGVSHVKRTESLMAANASISKESSSNSRQSSSSSSGRGGSGGGVTSSSSSAGGVTKGGSGPRPAYGGGRYVCAHPQNIVHIKD